MNIVVLAGGYSPEREVSLTSGSLIANALIKNGHSVLLLDAYCGIRELPRDPFSLFKTEANYSHTISEEIPDLQKLKEENGNSEALIGPNVLWLCRMADRVFLALHGAMGENGQLQATLDSYGIRYTGSGYVGSALAMDKDLAKRLLRDAGVRTPDWVFVDPTLPESRTTILEKVGLPCVIKPTSCGSSVGVTIVEDENELDAALAAAAPWGDRVLAEKKIVGRELTVGILDGKTLPSWRSSPTRDFTIIKTSIKATPARSALPKFPSVWQKRLPRQLCAVLRRFAFVDTHALITLWMRAARSGAWKPTHSPV